MVFCDSNSKQSLWDLLLHFTKEKNKRSLIKEFSKAKPEFYFTKC